MPSPPPLEIEHAGTRVRVRPHGGSDDVGDLAAALGLDRATGLMLDGRAVSAHQSLVAAGLRNGSRVSRSGPTRAVTRRPPTHEVAVVAGTCCRRPIMLAPGRHVIGRSSSTAVHLDDPAVELHHALLEIDDAGTVTFRQLTGRVPARVDSTPCAGAADVPDGGRIELGPIVLVVRAIGRAAATAPSGRLRPAPNDPWRRIVQRGPEHRCTTETAVRVPIARADDSMPPATGLVAGGVAVVGAATIALLTGQLLFALFAVIGAVASVATWGVGAVAVVRRRRAGRSAERADHERFASDLATWRTERRARHARESPTIEDALRSIAALDGGDGTDVWRRRTTPGEPLRAVLGRGTMRWAPPLDGDDGSVAWGIDGEFVDAAIPIELSAAAACAVRGDEVRASALVRSLLVQLATHHGPVDWRPVIVARDPRRWSWLAWLPHAGPGSVVDATDPDAVRDLVDGLPADDRRTVLVVDDVDLLASRTGALRRFIGTTGPATIAILSAGSAVPGLCDRTVDVGADGAVSVADVGGGDVARTHGRAAGVSVGEAAACARRLAGLIDPEDATSATMPSRVDLADVDPVIAAGAAQGSTAGGDPHGAGDVDDPAVAAVVRRWQRAGADPRPSVVVGVCADGPVEIDLVADGPHALIAGTTGSGKSELLRALVVGLALRNGPEHVNFVLVDYKGGSSFDACTGLVHTVGVVTDLDDGLAARALVSLDAELRRRERLLRGVGATDLTAYRMHPRPEPLPRLVVVVDEFAALAQELPEFLSALVGIAQRGRSLGIHLVLATQRPAGVVSDDIRANTNLRLALRLADSADARDIVADEAPARFPRTVPGRAALRLGPNELLEFQVATCTGPAVAAPRRLRVEPLDADDERPLAARPVPTPVPAAVPGSESETAPASTSTQLDVAVAVIAGAAQRCGTPPPHRPWVAQLPERVALDAIDGVPANVERIAMIGVVDDPASQRRRPLAWGGGNLALVGPVGSGRTSTLVALVVARCRSRPAAQSHCYVLDAFGDPAFDRLSDVAHCGGVVRSSDVERVHRLLARIAGRLDDPSPVEPEHPTERRPAIVLAIDGLASVRAALDSVDRAATLALLDRVLADGAAGGVEVWWTDEREPSALDTVSDTWHFGPALRQGSFRHGPLHLGSGTNGNEAAAIPGRLRIASSGLAAQVAVDAADLTGVARRADGDGPPGIDRLPPRVRAAAVLGGPEHAPDAVAGGTVELPVGVADEGLGVATLSVPHADHVLIGGGALTGKTTTLLHLSRAWRHLHPGGCQLFVDRRDPLTGDRFDAVATRPLLVVVDDADRVDDIGGTLASILAGEHPGVTIVAAARLDAVRANYGHWTRDVARSRCGVILTSPGEVDGDLLGVMLPRRALVAPRPGLGWVIDRRGHRLVQVAQADVEFVGG